MVDGVATLGWIDRSRPFFTSLSEALGREQSSAITSAEPISCALRSWLEWAAHNPCPDPEFFDRVLLLAARYGYVVLAGAQDWENLDSASKALMNTRLKELNRDLKTLMSEVEQLGTGPGVHSSDG